MPPLSPNELGSPYSCFLQFVAGMDREVSWVPPVPGLTGDSCGGGVRGKGICPLWPAGITVGEWQVQKEKAYLLPLLSPYHHVQLQPMAGAGQELVWGSSYA